MHWRFYLVWLNRREVLAILLVALVVAAMAILAVTGRQGQGWLGALLPNFGFSANWHCTWVGKGDPVCIKDNAKPAAH